jgi:peptidoglycan/LPS O-acetylase OafA/YrhL
VSSCAPAERLDVLDGLRGLAIGLVVWYHAWLVSGQGIAGLNFFAEAGFLGVDLFFFISGFCVFYPYARAQRADRPLPTTRRFIMRRARKILPSYLLALGVFAIVYHGRFASPSEAALQLASHVTFLHTLFPLTFGAISGPLWTIGVEVQFYLLFPLIVRWFSRMPITTLLVLIGIAESYRLAVGLAGFGSTFVVINQLPAYLDVFGSGMFAAWLLTRLDSPATRSARVWWTVGSLAGFAVAVAALAQVASISRNADIGTAYEWVNTGRIAIGPLCVLLTVSTIRAATPWRSMLTMRVLGFLSLISYNLYLWNLEIAVWYHEAGFPPLATFVCAIATTVILATAITYAVERPILAADLSGFGKGLLGRFQSRLLDRAR